MATSRKSPPANYPVLVLIAGFVWMIVGLALLGLGALNLAFLLTSNRSAPILMVMQAALVGIGGLFLLLGIQSVRGSGKSCMVPGIIK